MSDLAWSEGEGGGGPVAFTTQMPGTLSQTLSFSSSRVGSRNKHFGGAQHDTAVEGLHPTRGGTVVQAVKLYSQNQRTWQSSVSARSRVSHVTVKVMSAIGHEP